ncbi:regulatory protein, luxR family [Amycolatopsis arida]|uniref:Regulatory protein, luxR family n=1 Tax=Amycolatopsis arida TaxID=587909 RepID=A0A1I5VLM6_9PSEU|nr:LuxR family transcriptional regulator [Amycolatopsis arida]TDX87922.1 regulatory LuxR family protein [Amycolatopsis arida]SFQ07886.1 regulatory protein, luxR family [Amycolatopsis arida]
MHLVPRLGSGIPLVARAAELGRLREAFARAEAGAAGAVLVGGDAGVGKTRLVTELAEHAAAAGALVLTGRCLDVREGGLPYLPFAEALTPLATADDAAVLAAMRNRPALGRLLPQLAPAGASAGAHHQPLPPAAQDSLGRGTSEQDLGQLQLFDAILGVLTELAADRPVVLVVEDLHWADTSTRNLLSFLISRLRAQRLLLVASYREEDVHRRHPLRPVLAELVRLPAVQRIDLPPMGEADARALVEALAEGPLDPALVDTVVERSEGNPFFAEELLASGPACADLPAGLAEVLLARLERLPADARQVVRVASVANGRVSHAALAEVSGLGERELDEALRAAVQHHVLVVERGYYAFRHALLREAVYGDLLPGERSRMHAAYAARLLGQPDVRGRDAALAYHSLQSNDLPTALAAAVRAADQAEKLGAPGSALGHVEQALRIWDAVPAEQRPDGVDEHELLHEASYFAGASGQPERSIAYARSAVAALDGTVRAERAAKTWRRLALALMSLDSTRDEAVEAVERAWELVADAEPSPARVWVLATRAQFLRNTGQFAEALRCAQAAVADARTVGSPAGEADALVVLGALTEHDGEVARARELLDEAMRKAHAADASAVALRALYFLGLSHDDHGELDRAQATYRRALDYAEEAGLTWSSFGIEIRLKHLFLRYVTGDWPEVDAAVLPERTGSTVVTARMAAAWAHIAVGRGDLAVAERLVADVAEQWRTDTQIPLSGGAARAELAFWRGDHAVAVRGVRETVGWLEEFTPWQLGGIRLGAIGITAAAAWAASARLRGDDEAVTTAVAEGGALLEHVRGCAAKGWPRTGTLGPEGRAWLARAEAAATCLTGAPDPELWAEAVRAFDYGAVYEQAICRWQRAEALLAHDGAANAAAAAEELADAAAVAERLGARPLRDAVRDTARRARVDLPGQAARRDVVSPLTDRELAVLRQVALGRTNRQVGAELYISEKTVSVHLSRAMAKLGASRRAEAVAIAYDRGLL